MMLSRWASREWGGSAFGDTQLPYTSGWLNAYFCLGQEWVETNIRLSNAIVMANQVTPD